MGFIQQAVPKPKFVHSDLECLNLNITVPKSNANGDSVECKLPVFIWMHGGGFVVGANSWPHYDHARLVKLANENGVPVIGIGLK
jgi:carboxylesterase type B